MPKHPHAELMMEYAKDAMETDKPWERWEYKNNAVYDWIDCTQGPFFDPHTQYRRKTKPYEPTLLDQAIELEIEQAKMQCKYPETHISMLRLFSTIERLRKLCDLRTPAMIEHLKSQGKL